MGLLSIIRKLRQEEREMRVLMLGLDGAGKTTIVKKILGRDVNVIEPTLGFNIETIPVQLEGDSQPYQVNVWDVGGQKSIRTFWKNYFEQTEGLVWVVDCSDRSRLKICKEEMSAVSTVPNYTFFSKKRYVWKNL
jgi:ADP-ribosylation factor-like protein 2